MSTAGDLSEAAEAERVGPVVLRAPRRHLPAVGWTWAQYTAKSFAQRLRRPRTEVLFYPDQPASMHYVVWKICAELGLRITGRPSPRTALAFLWKDATFIGATEAASVAPTFTINSGCRDISKSNVSRHFGAVFGYSCDLDPRTYCGPCVEKSNQNARHDGRIVIAPVAAPRSGAVYQRLINNIVRGDLAEDIRVPVVNGTVPFVYLKYRSIAARFDSNRNRTVQLCAAEDVLSADELRNIGRFTRSIGLDYGELDVLRDRDDGRIYIVDANKTPAGPSYRLRSSEFRRAVRTLALAFREQFLRDARGC
jgi:hypothetical protein